MRYFSERSPREPRPDVSRQASDERRRTGGRGFLQLSKRKGFRFRTRRKERKMATKTQTIEVKVDERLAGEIAGKAVHGWHATAYSDGKRRVYVTFEEVKTVGK